MKSDTCRQLQSLPDAGLGGSSVRRVRPSGARAAAPRSILLRMRVAIKRHVLTRELAEGTNPAFSPERALCAARLVSDRGRRQLAPTLRPTISEAHQPAIRRSPMVIIQRRAVFQAEEAIKALIERLGSSEPVRAEGMAIAQRIVSDAESSPMSTPPAPHLLRRVMLLATATL
jgi:hypothetical protein